MLYSWGEHAAAGLQQKPHSRMPHKPTHTDLQLFVEFV